MAILGFVDSIRVKLPQKVCFSVKPSVLTVPVATATPGAIGNSGVLPVGALLAAGKGLGVGVV
jgi:hypothetical protein